MGFARAYEDKLIGSVCAVHLPLRRDGPVALWNGVVTYTLRNYSLQLQPHITKPGVIRCSPSSSKSTVLLAIIYRNSCSVSSGSTDCTPSPLFAFYLVRLEGPLSSGRTEGVEPSVISSALTLTPSSLKRVTSSQRIAHLSRFSLSLVCYNLKFWLALVLSTLVGAGARSRLRGR